jgi:hypothetical protein
LLLKFKRALEASTADIANRTPIVPFVALLFNKRFPFSEFARELSFSTPLIL